MKIIDAHAHIYERLSGFGPKGEARAVGGGMVEWSTGKRERFLREIDGDFGFHPERLIELMDEGGIERAVILQGSNYGLCNSFIAESVKKYPSRLVGAGSFDPYCAQASEILKNLTENYGFRTIKFELSEHYGFAGYHPDLKFDGEIFAPHLAYCAENGLTVVLDTGVMGTRSFQIREIKNVILRHPNLTLVIAHSLFPLKDDKNDERLELIKLLSGDNVYFDIANLNAPKGETYRLEYIRAVVDIVGAEHVAWGTDCPGVFIRYSYAELVDYIVGSGLFNAAELEMIMGKTAEKLYMK